LEEVTESDSVAFRGEMERGGWLVGRSALLVYSLHDDTLKSVERYGARLAGHTFAIAVKECLQFQDETCKQSSLVFTLIRACTPFRPTELDVTRELQRLMKTTRCGQIAV
jgi:hypothetical protein